MIVDEEEEVETNMLFCKYCPKFQTNDDKYLIEHIKDKHSFQCDKCSFFCSSAKLLETHIINSHKKGENLQCKFCGLNGFLNKAMLDLHEERIHFVTEFGCLYCEKKSTSASDLRVHVAHAHSYTNRMTLKIKKMTKIVPKHPRQPIITTRVKTSSVPNVPRVKPSHKLTLSSALQKTVTKRPTLVSQAKSEDPLHIFENVQVKEEKNYETPEKQSTVQKDVGYKTKKNSSSIVIKGDVDDIFVEQMPEIIEKTTDKPNLVKASVPNFWSGYDDDKESSSATDLVECLDCHKQMTVEALFCKKTSILMIDLEMLVINLFLVHRLGEHPSLEKDDSLYERIPILPLPLRHKTQDVRHSTLLVACEFCFLEVFEKNLEKHILQCHSDSAKLFLCHVCSKEFTTECRLKYHLTSHDPDKMLTCDICDMKYTMKNRLRRHIERIHLGILIYKAECKICEQKLAQREKLEKHMRKYHTDGFDCGARANSETNFFDCYQCGASYVDLYTYRRHDCEKGRFQIRCNECLKPVKNLESLKIHQANNCLKKMVVKNKVLCYRPY